MRSPYPRARIGTIILALATFFPSAAFATETGPGANLALSATVVPDCRLQVTQQMIFPNYMALSNPNADTSTASVSVQCTPTYSSTAFINLPSETQTGSQCNTCNFSMHGPGSYLLGYNLSFNQTIPYILTQNVATGDGLVHPVTIYGSIPPTQNVQPGTYLDSVTISVSF